VVNTAEQRPWFAWLPLAATVSLFVAVALVIVNIITGVPGWLVAAAVVLCLAAIGGFVAVAASQAASRAARDTDDRREPRR
jgi:hypothetical protein